MFSRKTWAYDLLIVLLLLFLVNNSVGTTEFTPLPFYTERQGEVSLKRYHLSRDLKEVRKKLTRRTKGESFRQKEKWARFCGLF